MDKDEVYKLINWYKNTDTQGMDMNVYFFPKLMKAYGNDVEEILSFLDTLTISDLKIVSGSFENIYAKFLTEDVYNALGKLEDKLKVPGE